MYSGVDVQAITSASLAGCTVAPQGVFSSISSSTVALVLCPHGPSFIIVVIR